MDSQGKAKVALTFALYQGDQLVRRDTIAQDIVKVGKDPRSHLRVDDDLASRMHAVIEVASPADITLIDLGNEPGTLVNGQRVNKCKVRPGDQIQIGSTLIVLENAEPATASPPQSRPRSPPRTPHRRRTRRTPPRPRRHAGAIRSPARIRSRRRRLPAANPVRGSESVRGPRALRRLRPFARAVDAVRRAGAAPSAPAGVGPRHRASARRRRRRLHLLDGEERSGREPRRGRGRARLGRRGDDPLGLERPSRVPPDAAALVLRRRRVQREGRRATTSSRARRSGRRARRSSCRAASARRSSSSRARAGTSTSRARARSAWPTSCRPGRARPSTEMSGGVRVRASGRARRRGWSSRAARSSSR